MKKYKGPAAAVGIAYTVSETIKNIRQTLAIIIPEPRHQTPPESTSQVDSSTVSQAYSSSANSVDLAPIARAFPYVKPETQLDSDLSLAEPNVFYPYPSYDPLRGHTEIDSPTGGSDINPDFNIFHSRPNIFDPSVVPDYLSPDFIQKSSEAPEPGKLLLQQGLA